MENYQVCVSQFLEVVGVVVLVMFVVSSLFCLCERTKAAERSTRFISDNIRYLGIMIEDASYIIAEPDKFEAASFAGKARLRCWCKLGFMKKALRKFFPLPASPSPNSPCNSPFSATLVEFSCFAERVHRTEFCYHINVTVIIQIISITFSLFVV